MTRRLEGDVAIVTGGASGIGRGISDRFAAEGAAVVVADLDAVGARTAAEEIAATGATALGIACDVRDRASVDAMVDEAVDALGAPTILINNAGYCRVLPFMEVTEDVATDLWRVHVLGSMLCSQSVLRHMQPSGYGRIVMIVSGDKGYGASPLTTMYQSSKSAQTSLARGIALAVLADGITVNCISPGLVETALWDALEDDYRHTKGISAKEEIEQRIASSPVDHRVTPAEIGDVALFFCDRASRAVTGQVVEI